MHLKAAYETPGTLGAETLRRRVARAMKDAGIEPPRAPRARRGELTDTEVAARPAWSTTASPTGRSPAS